jgi:signal transduction histidine kinase
LRDTDYTNKYLTKEFIPKVESYYKKGSKTVDLIFSCFSEVLLNFWEHAVEDTKSVIIADGTKNKIEIACADTGIGIIQNLTDFFEITKKKEELLIKALEKGMTTKPNTNHMGFGLWIVNELVKANNGKLHIYSQGYYYSNNFGKVKYGTTSYWPGTVIYIYLNLSNPKTVYDVLKDSIISPIKINFT